jgi:hypothetical protein
MGLTVIEDVWARSVEDNLGQKERGRKSNKEELNIDHHRIENWHLTPSGEARNAHKILTRKSEGKTYVSWKHSERKKPFQCI